MPIHSPQRASGVELGGLPHITVVIPSRNEEHHIVDCLSSIVSGTYPRDRLEVLVVDGHSEDHTRDLVSAFAVNIRCVRLLENPARVVPNAMNIGIRAARGELIVRADAHARYPSDYLIQLVSWMQRLRADNVGGVWVMKPANASAQAGAVALILSHPFGVGDAQYRISGQSLPTEVDTVPFGCYRREVFDRIGFYDETFIRNQDDEFNARLVRAGGRIFLIPQIKINYFTRDSLRKMAKMLYQYGYFKPLVALKLGRPATWRQLAPPVFTLTVVGLPLLFWTVPAAISLWAIAVAAHVCVNCTVSVRLAVRRGWRFLPFLLGGFPVAHLAYGVGYLHGILDFAVMRRHLKAKRADLPLSR
jgi:glycosyltransferase involved in cell wall biosynthesis